MLSFIVVPSGKRILGSSRGPGLRGSVSGSGGGRDEGCSSAHGWALPRASGPFIESQRWGRRRKRSTASILFEYLRAARTVSAPLPTDSPTWWDARAAVLSTQAKVVAGVLGEPGLVVGVLHALHCGLQYALFCASVRAGAGRVLAYQ